MDVRIHAFVIGTDICLELVWMINSCLQNIDERLAEIVFVYNCV